MKVKKNFQGIFYISLILFFTFAVMIKNNNNNKSPFFLHENLIRFQANNLCFNNHKKTLGISIFTIIESITLDLPIAYANIRV
jgi:hypothetical protein